MAQQVLFCWDIEILEYRNVILSKEDKISCFYFILDRIFDIIAKSLKLFFYEVTLIISKPCFNFFVIYVMNVMNTEK